MRRVPRKLSQFAGSVKRPPLERFPPKWKPVRRRKRDHSTLVYHDARFRVTLGDHALQGAVGLLDRRDRADAHTEVTLALHHYRSDPDRAVSAELATELVGVGLAQEGAGLDVDVGRLDRKLGHLA